MTCWLGLGTTLTLAVLEIDGWCVESERLLVSILSAFVNTCKISWAEPGQATEEGSCLDPRKDVNSLRLGKLIHDLLFVWLGWDTTLIVAVLEIDGWCIESEWMLVSRLSAFIIPREMSWVETALALTLLHDLNLENMLKPFLLMLLFKKSNLS